MPIENIENIENFDNIDNIQENDPLVAVDPATFRAVMSRWASGITIVTCREENGAVHGMTASAFSSVSLLPPLVLVCVDRRNRTHRYIREQGRFGVQILREDMQDLSDRCAGFRGEEGHCLEDVPHHYGPSGTPILDESLAWLDCVVWKQCEAGDHTVYFGKIEAAGAGEGEPLLWFERAYRRLKPGVEHPERSVVPGSIQLSASDPVAGEEG
jgi:flavin reductase (DIM6/NTAB) family NADH-FMN oxidoreductase RutF